MDITIRNLQTKVPLRLPAVKRVVERTLGYLGQTQGEVSIVFVSPQRMRVLNSRHLKHHYSTDILTFDYRGRGDSVLVAEIVICPSVARRNAQVFSKKLEYEIALYLVHGILHLMGYNDHAAKETAVMRAKEQEVMSYLFTRIG